MEFEIVVVVYSADHAREMHVTPIVISCEMSLRVHGNWICGLQIAFLP